MIEIPEALTLARQINQTVSGKEIAKVVAGRSPHKFAWYHGEPGDYPSLLEGKTIGAARAWGGLVEISASGVTLVFGDGVNLRYLRKGEPRPEKHQLMLEFSDCSALSGSVAMYGGLWCFRDGCFDNPYYEVAKEKPSVLSAEFSPDYFARLLELPKAQKLSAKAFLATEQRIPGLGNGVLQDVLYHAGVHPKCKMNALSDADKDKLFESIKQTLAKMTELGGRDTEKDLFGRAGGYVTRLSKNTLGKACPKCGSLIERANYLGGRIYYCAGCQVLAS